MREEVRVLVRVWVLGVPTLDLVRSKMRMRVWRGKRGKRSPLLGLDLVLVQSKPWMRTRTRPDEGEELVLVSLLKLARSKV